MSQQAGGEVSVSTFSRGPHIRLRTTHTTKRPVLSSKIAKKPFNRLAVGFPGRFDGTSENDADHADQLLALTCELNF